MASPSALELARQLQLDMAELRRGIESLEKNLDTLEGVKLRESVAVLLDRVEKLEAAGREADKRQWQFVYITLGVIGSLLSGLVVQLLLWALKK